MTEWWKREAVKALFGAIRKIDDNRLESRRDIIADVAWNVPDASKMPRPEAQDPECPTEEESKIQVAFFREDENAMVASSLCEGRVRTLSKNSTSILKDLFLRDGDDLCKITVVRERPGG